MPADVDRALRLAKPLTVVVAVALCLMVAAGLISARGRSDIFPQPEERRSARGLLHTTLRAAIEPTVIRDQQNAATYFVRTPTFEGTIPAPTLRVKPGDWLAIDLPNDLPLNPEHARMGAFPHQPSTTNLHTHGLTVSPQGIADNVLREMEPGTANSILVNIPDDHPSGTFWYHPHKHGSVTYQMFGGMAGFLIVDGGTGTLDDVPEVKAAREALMMFQVIRTRADGQVPFVEETAAQLGTNPNRPVLPGLWSTLSGTNTYTTTNGAINPVIYMRPGEVQRWRWLGAGSGETFVVALAGHALNIVANDGITVPTMRTLPPGEPYVLASGQRADVLVKAGAPGVYLLQALDPADTRGWSVVSGSGIDPRPRQARISFDTPPAPYPTALATLVVSGPRLDMSLPSGPLPVPRGLPGIATTLDTPPARTRRVAFEICGNQGGAPVQIPMEDPTQRLPSCGAYYQSYDAGYWGGAPFTTLLMMRDAADDGMPNPNPNPEIPRVGYRTEGLFTADRPLFNDMVSGTFEEWTIVNRTFSDHSFHIHQNHFLVTHVNGTRLLAPEWHDTILVPAAEPQPFTGTAGTVNINEATFGSVTFRTYFKPGTEGAFVTHCHMLQHEDLGMMQRLDVVAGIASETARGRAATRGPSPRRLP